ncbi:YlbL family protein [Arthrobacter sp. H41]|uniref:YlbL family protein n=1 Tax=Arthrobacter sp. H41 TaxID=1312978 RepID=UPI00047EC1CF|nr:S16 family serine protease [Arthrobacter sp. H41]
MTHPPQFNTPDAAGTRPRDPRFPAMVVSGALAVVLGGIALLLPAPYVVESPGPTFNTIGEVDDQPLIEVSGAQSYPAEGELSLTTVFVQGGPNGQVSIFDAFGGWVDPDRDVLPEEVVYPPGTTQSELREQNSVAMTSSQESAIAAAFGQLDIDFSESLTVAGLAQDSASAEILEEGDILESIDGTDVVNISTIRTALNDAAGDSVTLTVQRDGASTQETVAPKQSEEGDYQLGVLLRSTFQFPFDVTIQLDNVGGPSAGMMFALGIIDTLTAGNLTGGRSFAGTGTIDSMGDVGPIGGIGQKLVGARSEGAEVFLAPAENCNEVVGNIPDGLTVVSVETLDDAVEAVEVLADGGDAASLPSCS